MRHTILTSRELMWLYACSWDVRCDLTLNSMRQIHTSVTLLTSRDLTCSSGRLTCQHASHVSVLAHISWDVTYVSSALQSFLSVVCRNGGNAYWTQQSDRLQIRNDKWEHQLDATIKYIFHLKLVSTCFGREIAHHQEITQLYISAYGNRPFKAWKDGIVEIK